MLWCVCLRCVTGYKLDFTLDINYYMREKNIKVG